MRIFLNDYSLKSVIIAKLLFRNRKYSQKKVLSYRKIITIKKSIRSQQVIVLMLLLKKKKFNNYEKRWPYCHLVRILNIFSFTFKILLRNTFHFTFHSASLKHLKVNFIQIIRIILKFLKGKKAPK